MEAEEKRVWLALIRALKSEFPSVRPVRVRRRPLKKSHAVTITSQPGRGKPGTTTIYISNADCFSQAIDALVHEWAHVIDAHERFDGHDAVHSETWGVCYSKVYRRVAELLEDLP